MAAESKLQRRVIKLLKETPRCWYINVLGSAMQKAGTPDLLICCNGVFCGLELKAPGETPKVLQVKVCELIERANGSTLISDDFDEIAQWLYEIDMWGRA